MGRTSPKKNMLLPNAVPSIQTFVSPHTSTSFIGDSPLCTSTPKPKRQRSAFLKRENRRLINDILQEDASISVTETSETTCTEVTLIDVDEYDLVPTVLETPTVRTRTCSTQLSLLTPNKRSRRPQTTPRIKDSGCQTEKPKMRSVEVQCNILKPDKEICPADVSHHDLEQSWTSSDHRNDTEDSDYMPSEPDSDLDDDFDEESRTDGERLFLVSESSLLDLFHVCPRCCSSSLGHVTFIFGTLVKIEQDCGLCGHHRIWNSQSFVGSIPLGNIRLSCGIIFSGSLPSLKVFQFMNCPSISRETFHQHQSKNLQPTVVELWKDHQAKYIEETKRVGRPICIGGDGRCDTPGHSAKFGTYSVMDLDKGKVIDVQLVQSNEVKSSCHMEKEGVARSVEFLNSNNLHLDTIVTDRHVQIRKWVRENMGDTKHRVDVWHVAKGKLKKKVLALSKERDCGELASWIRSITNHLYWVAASTPDADRDLMMQKWQSLGNGCHIQNVHEGHGDKFPNCRYPDLTGQERRKRWLKPGLEKLLPLLNNRQMNMDIPMLSTNQQTSDLEDYHSVINHFAPKMHGFSYHGMVCRLLLAAMHFNENGGREAAVDNDGNTCYAITFPKHKKGEYTVREVKKISVWFCKPIHVVL